jgi:hypothetical protein
MPLTIKTRKVILISSSLIAITILIGTLITMKLNAPVAADQALEQPHKTDSAVTAQSNPAQPAVTSLSAANNAEDLDDEEDNPGEAMSNTADDMPPPITPKKRNPFSRYREPIKPSQITTVTVNGKTVRVVALTEEQAVIVEGRGNHDQE